MQKVPDPRSGGEVTVYESACRVTPHVQTSDTGAHRVWDGTILVANESTHTSLFGGRGPGRCLKGSVPAKTGKSKRANKATPTRHLPVLPNAFDIDFTWGLPLSFPTFLEAQVRCAIERPADDERAFSTEGAQQVWEKKYQGLAIASRREAVTHFVTDLEVEEDLARRFETRSLKWRWATRGTTSKNEWWTTLCWCEQGA